MSGVLAIKLLAAPALVGLASLAGKRWGPGAAGLLGGLPLVAGPLLLVLWLTEGEAFVLNAAQAAPAGVWANITYMLTVGYASARWGWAVVIPLGWVGYLLTAFGLQALGLLYSVWFGAAVLPALWLAATRGLPRDATPLYLAPLPRAEVFARMGAAAALVWTLSALSARLGPQMTGALSGGPVAATVIPAFTLALSGRPALLLALRGFLLGLMGFVVCFLALPPCLAAWGALGVLPALVAGVATGLAAAKFSGGRSR